MHICTTLTHGCTPTQAQVQHPSMPRRSAATTNVPTRESISTTAPTSPSASGATAGMDTGGQVHDQSPSVDRAPRGRQGVRVRVSDSRPLLAAIEVSSQVNATRLDTCAHTRPIDHLLPSCSQHRCIHILRRTHTTPCKCTSSTLTTTSVISTPLASTHTPRPPLQYLIHVRAQTLTYQSHTHTYTYTRTRTRAAERLG
jgi:hypothetical protein